MAIPTGGRVGCRPPSCFSRGSAFFAVFALAACGGQEPSCVRVTTSALEGATSSASLLQADEKELAAIVGVSFHSDDGRETRRCTGTFVAPSMLVTAAHCLPDARGAGLEALIAGRSSRTRVAGVVVHPEQDLALIDLTPATEDPEQALIALALSPQPFSTGDLVQLAGYGGAASDSSGKPNFAVEEVVAADADSLTVSGHGFSGACEGDSGGPLLSRREDGEVRIYGVLARGHASCRAIDRYVRVDTLLGWLQQNSSINAPSRRAEGCGGVSQQGRCHGDLAVYCSESRLAADACGAAGCGWSPDAGGYRCVEAHDDACEGVGDLGRCKGAVAVRCNEGRLVKSDCGGCGGECFRSPKTGRSTCF